MIREINLKTGEEKQRDYTKEEIKKIQQGVDADKEVLYRLDILDKLNQIDIKSIRSLRNNELQRLSELEAEAIELRKKLK